MNDEVKNKEQLIAELKELRHRVQEWQTERDLWRGVMNTNVAAIAVFKPDGTVIFANDRAAHLLELIKESQPTEDKVWQAVDFETTPWLIERKPFQQILETGEPLFDMRHVTVGAQGVQKILSINGAPIKDETGVVALLVFFVSDITHSYQLETQLSQVQKMEAIGRLAGGIAHDFNNIMTVIMGNSDLVLDSLSPQHPNYVDIQHVRDAAHRASVLTKQLLAFSRQQVLQPKILNLNSVVIYLEKMLHRLIGEDIILQTELANPLGHIKADPGQLEQVIMNLVVNAREAMPQGGDLIIKTANIKIDAVQQQAIGLPHAGNYVLLSLRDTGIGMDATTKTRIFEPFFTTKAFGQGPGLGLATVHGIISQSGGKILVESEVGQGTHFKIYLPDVAAVSAVNTTSPQPMDVDSKRVTILLVEDEMIVRQVAQRVLRDHGYQVVEAQDGTKALEVFNLTNQHQPIDLLLTDVIMPGQINGYQLARQLLARHPDLKVICMSGYTDHHHQQEADKHHLAFLPKPFTPSSLLQKIQDVLQNSA